MVTELLLWVRSQAGGFLPPHLIFTISHAVHGPQLIDKQVRLRKGKSLVPSHIVVKQQTLGPPLQASSCSFYATFSLGKAGGVYGIERSRSV
jgi:hypothetical protein